MTNPYRDMCSELLSKIDYTWGDIPVDVRDLMDRARALLAQPVEEGPSDEEIMELMPQQMRDDLAAAARALAGFDRANVKAAGAMRIILNRHAVDHARAVLARWGRPTPQPVAVAPYREVADLVVWLEDHSAECLELDQPEWSKSINQAARFLHLYLRATPQPVAVSERLPRPEDCLDEGWAWFFNQRIGWRQAVLPVSPGYTHWLPAHALPVPLP